MFQEKFLKKIEKPQAYILNQTEFPMEYQILKKSHLYSLTDDSSTHLKIRIHKLKNLIKFRCMTGPVTVMLFTLGQFPVRIPENYTFQIEEIKNGEVKNIDFTLDIDKRIWFWDILSWRKSLKRELALSIRLEKVMKSNNR